ncbi:MAG: S41 family peptidase [Catalinimonas sp.]
MKARKKILLPVTLTLALITLLSANPSERYFEIAKNLDIFATLYKEVNTYYVDDIRPNTLIKTGIDAMLQSLDPYTNYIPEDEIEDYRTMTTGQYGGIGAVIGKRNGRTLVLMPYDGYPAHEAGLRIGDEILKVNDVDVREKSSSEVSKLLKGQANTTLRLEVERYKTSQPLNINITREKIKINNVPYYGMVNGEVGYLHLSDFTADASREVKKAVVDLKEQGAKKIIFDLRDNPGGLLSEAVNIANLFVPKDSDVVSTKGKVTEWNKTYRALNQPVDTDIPLVVLTSSHSASASEIVAGVIQDYDRGVLVGERTYGKGLVQATRPLTYNSQLKITTAKYYIPSGRCIQAIDYSHRESDGSVAKIPDSLRMAFSTASGRVVYDGGGIRPDVEVEERNYAPITVSLVGQGFLFDYATKYAYEHKSIAEPKAFALTDAEYDAFVAWLADKDYDYSTQVEANLTELTTNAKREKYYDAIKEQLTALEKQITHDKDKDLMKNREEIREQLEQEIVSRYYLQRGKVEASFDDDPDILAALQVLNDGGEFVRLLKP